MITELPDTTSYTEPLTAGDDGDTATDVGDDLTDTDGDTAVVAVNPADTASSRLPPDMPDLLRDARERVYDVVQHTPLVHSAWLSRICGVDVWLKLENLQVTGSFKLRGAYNRIASLMQQRPVSSLVAASSGNHAQGVAYAAKRFGIDQRTTIFMPRTTPYTKIQHTLAYGDVRIELIDGPFDLANRTAHDYANQTTGAFIEPYDDWYIIAGQATCGSEIVHDLPDVSHIIVPLGGGGLLSGISLAASAHDRRIRLYGARADSYHTVQPTLADGTRVKHLGRRTAPIIDRLVDDVVVVHDEGSVGRAVRETLAQAHTLSEGSGALGVAALLDQRWHFEPGNRVVVVISGGNIDLSRVAALLETS